MAGSLLGQIGDLSPAGAVPAVPVAMDLEWEQRVTEFGSNYKATSCDTCLNLWSEIRVMEGLTYDFYLIYSIISSEPLYNVC